MKLCLTDEQVKRIDNLLKEIEERDDDPSFQFLETLNVEESQKALDRLLKQLNS